MNRRTFLSALAATSLTPTMPAQIFAAGGYVTGDHVTPEFLFHSMPCAVEKMWINHTPAQIIGDINYAFTILGRDADPGLIVMPIDTFHRLSRA